MDDYLLALRERSEKASKGVTSPAVGNIVLIKDEGPRLYWKMGRVVKTHQGEDSVTRVATVKTATGESIRPITRLYALELNIDNPDIAGPEESEEDRTPPDVSVQPRVGTKFRRAARAAIDIWWNWLAAGKL